MEAITSCPFPCAEYGPARDKVARQIAALADIRNDAEQNDLHGTEAQLACIDMYTGSAEDIHDRIPARPKRCLVCVFRHADPAPIPEPADV